MYRKDLIDTIVQYASLFVLQIKGQTAINNHDLNVHAENAFIPILNTVFNLKLTNANQLKINHPAIDLIDDENGIAFQITATTTQEKIIKTLNTFIANDLYKKYHTLYICLLTEKNNTYNVNKIQNAIKGKFDFNIQNHIIDYRDILRQINYIESTDTLKILVKFYALLSDSSLSTSQLLTSIQHQTKGSISKIGRLQPFSDHIKEELGKAIGVENINKIPELSELFQKVETLNAQISQKKKESENCLKALEFAQTNPPLSDVLNKAYQTTLHAYENLNDTLAQTKKAIDALTQRIKRQKDFLDKMDQHQISERMEKARKLFGEGEFALANELLNYEGREEYIKEKLEEKKGRSVEWLDLANEEVFIALNMRQEKEWRQNISKIRLHFEQSIELGGYGFNAYQYSFFLEEIGDYEQAVDILKKVTILLPTQEIENRALTWKRLGDLLRSSDDKEALKAYEEAVIIYESLFEEVPHKYEHRIMLATVRYHCGSILVHQSLEQARTHLERALLLLSNTGQRGNIVTLRLTFIITITLAYMHQQLGDDQSMGSYSIIAIEVGGMLAIEDPDEGAALLLKAINRIRKLLGEEDKAENTALIYDRALNYFLKFHKKLSFEKNYHHARQLIKIGLRLLTFQETIGAEICFRSALKNFRALEKLGHICAVDIADALDLVGFIYMTKNNSKAAKRVFLEAINILSRLATEHPEDHLPKMASILDELYLFSFIAVPASQYYKANRFFDKALEIYKRLDKEYNQLNIDGWKQLVQHRATMLSQGLDKTDVVVFYQELSNLRNRIAVAQPNYNNEWFHLSIHKIGELLSKDLHINHPLFDPISRDIIEARTSLFEKEPEKYNLYLAYALSKIGQELLDGHQNEKACTYLQKSVLLFKKLASKEPSVYEKALVIPMFKLAYGYTQLKEYNSAIPYFTYLCNYFESRLDENPEYLTLLVSFMLSTTEAFIYSQQNEEALNYIVQTQSYIPGIPDNMQRKRLEQSFKELSNKLN